MKEIKNETWGTVAAQVAIEDDGDINLPLKRVEAQYRAKAQEIGNREPFEQFRVSADFYLNAAEAVRNLQ